MTRINILPVAVLLSLLPSFVLSTAYGTWAPPGPGDVRSPCPGLNTLANHGILPRSGKGITVPMLNVALLDGYNVGHDFSTVIGGAGLLSSPNPLSSSFDLNNLDEHNFPIEHDASLSRQDYNLGGNDYSFNQEIFNTVLAYFGSDKNATIPTAGPARFNRVLEESKADPKFTYTAQTFILSYGETGLYLSVMGDPITGSAPVEYVKIFFEEERLPYEEGWTKPKTQTNLATLAAMAIELNAATGEEIPEGLIISEHTLALAFAGNNPITGKLADL